MIYKHDVSHNGLIGFIEIEMLPWKERIKKTRDILYKQDGEKLVERQEIDQGEMTITLSIEQIRKIDLSFGDKKITDIEELMMYREGIVIINQLNSIVLNGVSLEKK
jgi:hypothetical protein